MTPQEQQAFNLGRLQGLREMDMACGLMLMDLGVYTGNLWSANYAHMLHLDAKAYLFKLRQEYQNN